MNQDSEYTSNDLLAEGIPANIVDAVTLLTKVENESYEQFIQNILSNKLASKVKMADIEDNINVLRLDVLHNIDLERVGKYHKAWMVLKESIGT